MPNQYPVDSRNPRRTWLTLRDDSDVLDVMRAGRHVFLFVEITDMDDALGRENEGRERYSGDVKLVDLDALTPKQIADAQRSCGWDGADMSDPLVVAEMCQSYGYYAPLDGTSGNGLSRVRRGLRAVARTYATDADALSDAMERPVNRLGATAREYMIGDMHSAMQRGCEAGDPTARLMAKLHNIPDDMIDDARPVDWLPYVVGYMDAMGGHDDKRAEPDIAPEYRRGYERGERVSKGEATAPGWIR